MFDLVFEILLEVSKHQLAFLTDVDVFLTFIVSDIFCIIYEKISSFEQTSLTFSFFTWSYSVLPKTFLKHQGKLFWLIGKMSVSDLGRKKYF